MCLVYGKICKTCSYWVVCVPLSTSRIVCVSQRLEWLGCWRQQWYLIALFCRDAWMIKIHLYIALLCSQCAENVNPIVGIGACCYNRFLIFVLCFAISFRGYIPSSFPWFCKHDITTSCFLVTTFSSHHCIFGLPSSFCLWLLLHLIDYCHKVALSC